MRMSISLIQHDGEPAGVLYQSVLVTEAPRVPVPLFTGATGPAPTAAAGPTTIFWKCAHHRNKRDTTLITNQNQKIYVCHQHKLLAYRPKASPVSTFNVEVIIDHEE